jgi:hypothetical protein
MPLRCDLVMPSWVVWWAPRSSLSVPCVGQLTCAHVDMVVLQDIWGRRLYLTPLFRMSRHWRCHVCMCVVWYMVGYECTNASCVATIRLSVRVHRVHYPNSKPFSAGGCDIWGAHSSPPWTKHLRSFILVHWCVLGMEGVHSHKADST